MKRLIINDFDCMTEEQQLEVEEFLSSCPIGYVIENVEFEVQDE
jgi:hypothetical protein